MASQVVRPSIPYLGHIPGGIHDGKMIEIRGCVPYGADSFSINLCTGLDHSCDRAFHLSARFHGRVVVRNSRERNEWCEEERSGGFPFHSGRDFTVMILVETLCYRIAVNSQHYCEFYHRIPMDRVQSLLIEGSVDVECIEFIDKITPYQPGYPPTSICPGRETGYNPNPFPPAVCDPPTTYYPGDQVDPGFYRPPAFIMKPPRTHDPAARIRRPVELYRPPGVCDPPSTIYPSGRISPGFLPYQPPGVCNPPPTDYPSGRISPGYIPNITPSNPTYPGGCIIPPPEQQITPGYITTGGSNLAPVYNPVIPYSYPIYGGLRPGMMVFISGRPSASAYSFTINFQNGTSPYNPPDIAFHISARFYNHTVVRNTRINNVWEREETQLSHFPFQQSVNFDLIIKIEHDKFMVAHNGQHLFEFRHRLMPLDRFDTLYIENDIVVSSIRFN